VPEPVRAKLQQMEAQLQQVTQAYEEAQEAISTDRVKTEGKVALKEAELAAEAASQERDLQGKLQLERVRQESESARTLARIEQERASEILQTKIAQLQELIARDVAQSNMEEARFEQMATGRKGGAAAPPGPPPQQAAPPPPPPVQSASPGVGGPPLPPGGPPASPGGPPVLEEEEVI
jgi:hypothetical protein